MADITMFGPGGESLAGFFIGEDQSRKAAEHEAVQAKTLADIANTQEITRQRQLGNQLEAELMPDKIAAYRTEVKNKAEDRQWEQFGRMGQGFGQLSTMLEQVPPAARAAALREMLGQSGIGADNQMAQTFLNMDPNQLPAAMGALSQKFYEQSTTAKEQAQKDKADFERSRMQRDSAEKVAADENAMRLKIAQMQEAGQNSRHASGIAAARERASTKDAASGGALGKMSTDQAISYLERKGAIEGLTEGEEIALYNLRRLKLAPRAIGAPDTGPAVMTGQQPSTATERLDRELGPRPGTPRTAPAATPQMSIQEAVAKAGQKYEPEKYDYRVTPDGRVQRKPK